MYRSSEHRCCALQVELAEQEWEAEKRRVTAAHTAAVKAAEEHTERIKPAVEVAKVAAQELQRVTAFLGVVRVCAAKASLGVNYIPGSPNLDRVVEMATLTSALEAAYPELSDPALQPPLAQCEVIPWPQEAWATQAPRGLSADASFRKTRAALAQIQAIQSGYRASQAENGASGGKQRPVSARCLSSRSRGTTHHTSSAEAVLNSTGETIEGPGTLKGMAGSAESDAEHMLACWAPLTAVPGRLGASKGVHTLS